MNRDFRSILAGLALVAFPLTAGASALPPAPRPSLQGPVVPAPNLADKLEAVVGGAVLLAAVPVFHDFFDNSAPFAQIPTPPFNQNFWQQFNNQHFAPTPTGRGMAPSQAFRAIRGS